VPGELFQVRAVNDHGILRDLDRQQLARPRGGPGHGVTVLAIGHEAFLVDRAIDDFGHLVRPLGQRNQVRQFFGMQVQGPAAGLAMHPHVGHVLQPPGRDFVQVLQRAEVAAAQQAGLHLLKRTFDFALGLGTPGTAGHRTVTVVRGEGQKTRIVDRLVIFVP